MKLIRYDYTNPGLLNDMDALFNEALNNLWRRGLQFAPSAQWTPAADLFEDEGNYYLRIEVPGMKKEHLNIELENQVLTISGEERHEGDNRQIVRSFNRSFPLPEGVDRETITAQLENGLLTIALPKAEARKPRAIEIQ